MSCGTEPAESRSAYPPILSVNADIPARQPSAKADKPEPELPFIQVIHHLYVLPF
jgi:hypothetical protein